MTRLVDGLERDGYVRRATDPDDARAVRVEATGRGRDALLEGRRRRVEAFGELLGVLSDRELARLANGVAALERALMTAVQPPTETSRSRPVRTS